MEAKVCQLWQQPKLLICKIWCCNQIRISFVLAFLKSEPFDFLDSNLMVFFYDEFCVNFVTSAAERVSLLS